MRKLPPDHLLAPIIRLGFRYSDIADRFDVFPEAVTARARRLGFPPIPLTDKTRFRRNMARPASRYFG